MLLSTQYSFLCSFDNPKVAIANEYLHRKGIDIEKQELPFYIGIIEDENHELKAINPQKYLLNQNEVEPLNFKKGSIYQIQKTEKLQLKKICDFSEIHKQNDHFIKIILASYDRLPRETCGEVRYYAGLMDEAKGDVESAFKWFKLSSDKGHCLALFQVYRYAKEFPILARQIALRPIEYLFAAQIAASTNEERDMIEEVVNEELNVDVPPLPAPGIPHPGI